MPLNINAWIADMPTDQLKKEFQTLWNLVNVHECFNAKDFTLLITMEGELERRGVQINYVFDFAKKEG